MKKQRNGNQTKAGWPRSFRFEPEQDFKLRMLALYYRSSLSEVIRLALNDFWMKHEDIDKQVDQTEMQREYRRVLRRILEEPL